MAARPIRPKPRPKNVRPTKPSLPPKGGPVWDSEEHFADYDHEAVLALSRQIIICPATYNRKGTVEQCVASTYQNRLEAKVYIHDDGSTEYDTDWLSQFGDRVFRHPHSVGGRQGVKNLRSNITKSILGQYKPEVFKPWLEEDFGPEGPKYIYMTDSDGYHDPYFLYRIHEIMEQGQNWGAICLYNATFHMPRKGRPEKNVRDYYTVTRGMCPGISMFIRVQSFLDAPKKIQVPDRRGWDGFYSQEICKRKIVTSLISYVEHFGKWGFHNKGDWERDRAINPTKNLASVRKLTIEKIEGEFTLTQRTEAKKAKERKKKK